MTDLGEALGHQAAAAAVAASNVRWKEYARKHLDWLISEGRSFTADDLWFFLDGVAWTREPRALGGIILAAANAGRIRAGHQVPTKRREAHGRRITVWHPVVEQ